jgi:uncharacterized membrane protein YeaQ/YmgE (transglycosylase-associated protein family)
MDIVWFVLIGIVAGFIAGKLMKSGDYGLIGNLIVGVIGALLGGFVMGILGLAPMTLVGRLVTATVGAMLFLALLRFIKPRR